MSAPATDGTVIEKGIETGAAIEKGTSIAALDMIATGIENATGPGTTGTVTVIADANGTTTMGGTTMIESREESPRLLMTLLLPLLLPLWAFHHHRLLGTVLARFALMIAAEAMVPETEAGMVVQGPPMMTTNLCLAAALRLPELGMFLVTPQFM